ncbi:hypothetical protein GCG21_15265 [Pseudactinotalea sp. HY160]|uniref:lysylphosphatidylglycerol synthase transmembrane domain-containing protein n=1 Tax=Pseudactinotalea sp. HY160 TaxID=2654490 RepID=UPI00128E73D9|nr:lysylphosphatidylglycerol synthase transmembrane domain-containing protein [Pseudactinotalea sp. HY160]MPV51343.1 hypothetical protein [Pseudactinotalea sp. HY160]
MSQHRPEPDGPRRSVRVVDIPLERVHRPVDLVLMVGCLVAIVAMLALSVYARGTTSGVTHDVQSAFSSVVRGILLVPITVIEGLLTIVLPVIVIVERLVRRNPRAVVEAIASAAVAFVATVGFVWLLSHVAPDRLVRSLQIWQDGALILSISPSVAALAALLTTTGTRATNRAVAVSWTLLWVALAVSVITGDTTIIGAIVAALLGRAFGLAVRYAMGVLSERVHGADLVDAIRRAGVDPLNVVRIGDETNAAELRLEVATPQGAIGYSLIAARAAQAGGGGRPGDGRPGGSDGGHAGDSGDSDGPDGGQPGGGGADAQADDAQADGTQADEPRADGTRAGEPRPGDARAPGRAASSSSDGGHWRGVWELVGDEPPTETTVQRIVAAIPEPATVTMEREGWNRVYAVDAFDGRRWDVVVLDEDRQVIGMLSQVWTALQLRGMGRRSATNLRQAADRAALMSYAAVAAGVNTPRLHGVAESRASVVLVGEHVRGAQAADSLAAEELTDEVMTAAWHQLLTAHAAGLSHRNLSGESVLVVPGARPQVWLSGWEQGEIASPSLTRRIDQFQLLATFALRIGVERAVAVAAELLTPEELAALAPVVQRVVLPPELQSAARSHKHVLRELRTTLAGYLPEQSDVVEPLKLTRFSARTVVMTTIALVAGWVLLTTLNFRDIAERMGEAEPGWLVVAFVLGMLTFLGAAMGLVAFSPTRLGLWRTALVQVAASVVVLVAPAGVGPAALNLRFMQRRRIDTPMAVATVALLQVSQIVTTVLLLVAIALFTGSAGALSQLPSRTIVVVLIALALIAGVVVSIPALRRFLAAKIMPTLRQVWPRVLWVVGQPGRLAMGIGGNLLMSVGYLAAFGFTLKAFGFTLPLTTLAIVFLTGNTVGAAVPTPGGIGAIEAALSTGLGAAGIGTAVALSTAVVFRVLTFWLRVPIGWVALRHLQKRGEV